MQDEVVAGADLRLVCWSSLPQGLPESNGASVGAKSTFIRHTRISLRIHYTAWGWSRTSIPTESNRWLEASCDLKSCQCPSCVATPYGSGSLAASHSQGKLKRLLLSFLHLSRSGFKPTVGHFPSLLILHHLSSREAPSIRLSHDFKCMCISLNTFSLS